MLTHFRAIDGQEHRLSAEQQRRVLALLGVPTATESSFVAWLRNRGQAPLGPLVRSRFAIRVPLSSGRPADRVNWAITPQKDYYEGGGLATAPTAPGAREGVATVEGTEFGPSLRLPECQPGYYQLTLRGTTGGHPQSRLLIVTPPAARPFRFGRGWGVAAQLYGLSSKDNPGPGDFVDALDLGNRLAQQGMDVLGLSPVHALYPANPAHVSPYSPSSRLFWNPTFARPNAGQRSTSLLQNVGQALASVVPGRGQRLDYPRLWPARLKALEEEFALFEADENHPDKKAFEEFCAAGGSALSGHALFDALYERFARKGLFGTAHWPALYQDPRSVSVHSFAREEAARVRFYCYAQFRARTQLRAVAEGLVKSRSSLYLDLAVGADPSGSEAWNRRDLFLPGVSIGAPPDPFAPQGQDWGLAPLSPQAMMADGYRHFVRMLRANMPPGGIIRMDHAMQLHRLYWHIHDGGAPFGAYVAYPEQDLMGILKLESHLQDCSVITEDLGTVPEGFRERLVKAGLYTWKVFYFEKDGEDFQRPAAYPTQSIATINTHDLPTVRSYWNGADIALRETLGLNTAAETVPLVAQRQRDRAALLRLIETTSDDGHQSTLSATTPAPEISVALHEQLARAGSDLVLTSLGDLLDENAAHNVPGTADRPENWSLAYSRPIESIAEHPLAKRIIAVLQRHRPRA